MNYTGNIILISAEKIEVMQDQAKFEVALTKFTDDEIQRLSDYILDGKKFLGQPESSLWKDGKGRGCVICVATAFADMSVCSHRNNQIYTFFGLFVSLFNDENYDKPVLYQLILQEAERRGLKKTEEEVIITP